MSTRDEFLGVLAGTNLWSQLRDDEREEMLDEVMRQEERDASYMRRLSYRVDNSNDDAFDLLNVIFMWSTSAKGDDYWRGIWHEMRRGEYRRAEVISHHPDMGRWIHNESWPRGLWVRITSMDMFEGVTRYRVKRGDTTHIIPTDSLTYKLRDTFPPPLYHVGDMVSSNGRVGVIKDINIDSYPYMYTLVVGRGRYPEWEWVDEEQCMGEFVMTDDTVFCDHCGELIALDDIRKHDGETLCPDCEERFFHECEYCGGTIDTRERLHTIINGEMYCDDCASERSSVCETCGEVFLTDDGYEADDMIFCSESCRDTYVEEHLLHEYSYRPEPLYLTTQGETWGGGYGVELEMEGGDVCVARDYHEYVQCYCKHDGSLNSDGLELVTHPATLAYHEKHMPWETWCAMGRDAGHTSHDNGDCGLHIHASRELFGDSTMEQEYTIAKIMLLIDKWWDDYIVPFTRRDIRSLSHWASKPCAEIKGDDTPEIARDKVRNLPHGRYVAVNLCPRHTVEFRIFRGTLKHTTILASLEFVDVLIKYARRLSLRSVQNITFDRMFSRTTRPHLRAYLAERNIITMEEK